MQKEPQYSSFYCFVTTNDQSRLLSLLIRCKGLVVSKLSCTWLYKHGCMSVRTERWSWWWRKNVGAVTWRDLRLHPRSLWLSALSQLSIWSVTFLRDQDWKNKKRPKEATFFRYRFERYSEDFFCIWFFYIWNDKKFENEQNGQEELEIELRKTGFVQHIRVYSVCGDGVRDGNSDNAESTTEVDS